MRERWTRLRHLIWKDWRGIQRWAALSWLTAGGAWLLLLYPDPQDLGQVQHGLSVFLPGLVIAHLFQEDSPLDTDGFWRTRPISAVQQFVSKLVVAGLGIALPWALLVSAPLAFRRLDMTVLQMVMALAGLAAMVAVGGSSLALGALLTRHLLTGGLISVAVYAAMVTALALSYRIWDANLAPAGIELRLGGLWLCLLLVVPLAVYLLYRTRRARLAGGVLAAGLALGLLLNHPWASAAGKAMMPAVPVPQGSWPNLSAAVEPGGGEIHDMRDGKTAAAYVKMTVKGLPAAYSLVQSEYETTARTSVGEQHQHWDKYPVDKGGLRTGGIGWIRYPSEVALGCKVWERWSGLVEVFRLDGSFSLQAVRGTSRFLIVRPFVAARYPVVSGGHVQGRGHRLEFEAASGSQPPRVRYEAVQAPFFIAFNPLRNAWFRDPSTGACLPAESRYILTMPPPPLRIDEVTPSRAWASSAGVADYSWAKELVVLSGEVVGSVALPFELEWGRPAGKS